MYSHEIYSIRKFLVATKEILTSNNFKIKGNEVKSLKKCRKILSTRFEITNDLGGQTSIIDKHEKSILCHFCRDRLTISLS